MVNIKRIIFFGAGAIGASVGAWVAEKYDETYFYARGKTKEALIENGITHYLFNGKDENQKENTRTTIKPVKILENLEEIVEGDVIVLSIKNYSLQEVSELIYDKCGDKPIIVSIANGRINQEILPKYFSKIIYCIALYNSWRDIKYLDAENRLIVGAQKRGSLIFGTPDNKYQEEMNVIKEIFNKSVKTLLTNELQDAVHCKIAINLSNSLTALIGHRIQPISDFNTFQDLMSNTIYEGVEIIRADGYKECQLGGMPPWKILKLGAKLPKFITRSIFKANIAKTQMSSMTQDMIQRKIGKSELESLTGYILKLADKNTIKAPYNRAIYSLCKEKFRENFEPLDVKDVMVEVNKFK